MYTRKSYSQITKEQYSGGAISPTLANITLDGIEEELHTKLNKGKKGKAVQKNRHKINFIRYADDCAPRAYLQVV